MWSYIFKRILVAIPTLLIISFMIFSLLYITPGDPVLLMLGSGDTQSVSQEQYDAVRAELGLDKPFFERYMDFITGAVTGDLGTSYITGEDVFDTVMMRMPATLILTVASVLVGLLVAVPLGILAAVKRGTGIDGFAMVLATIGISVPSFVICVLLMYLFCEKWKILPSYGLNSWKSYLLPVFCMAFSPIAYITRLMRSSMLEVMGQDYIRTERSKGVPEFTVIGKYALKNSILPVVTYIGPLVASLLTGTFIIEKLFSIPGLGRYFVSAISDRDYSVTLGLTVFLGIMIIVCNLVVDIMYVIIDPRVKIDE